MLLRVFNPEHHGLPAELFRDPAYAVWMAISNFVGAWGYSWNMPDTPEYARL
jgi:hypothetical protein